MKASGPIIIITNNSHANETRQIRRRYLIYVLWHPFC